MKRYEDINWRKSMRIRLDVNHMMETGIASSEQTGFEKQVGAITEEDIRSFLPKVERARATLSNKWGRATRMMAWTKLPTAQKAVVADILRTAKRIRKNFDTFVVLGIGGSALGPIAVQQALNPLHYNELPAAGRGGPRLYVEDNVDPERMQALLDLLHPEKTCFNVITKSGNTSETMSQFLILTHWLKEKLGDDWKRHMIATTDREKGNLIRLAKENDLKTFVVPDGVGGRFSELCPVGLLPAAVCGIDIEEMLAGAAYMMELCEEPDLYKNPGWMGGTLLTIAMTKKEKNIQVVMPYADSLKYMSDWYAQLWAESLGKKVTLRGKVVHAGQTPVKALGVTDQHSQVQLYSEGPFDKVITFLGVDEYRCKVEIPQGCEDMPDVNFLCGHTLNELIHVEQQATEYALTKAGKLNRTITLPQVNAFTVGELLTLWMVETAVAGELLGIDAFNQPGVEEGKNAAYALFGRPGYEEKRAELEARPAKLDKYVL